MSDEYKQLKELAESHGYTVKVDPNGKWGMELSNGKDNAIFFPREDIEDDLEGVKGIFKTN